MQDRRRQFDESSRNTRPDHTFKVTQLSNGTAADMRKALVDFGRSAEGSVMAVDFYAGHGMKAGGEDWLISTDGELRAKQSV